jgi:DNA-binding transcriptional ArsR family regulator
MLETYELTTTAHWKAISHPLRIGILTYLQKSAMTNEELAKLLLVESGKLYFHTTRLLSAGLIERAGTREKGPITEKLYRAAAKNYVAPSPIDDGSKPPLADMLASASSLYQSTWDQAGDSKGIMQLGYHIAVSIPKDRARKLIGLFKETVENLIAENGQDDAGEAYAVTLLMHSMPGTATGKIP